MTSSFWVVLAVGLAASLDQLFREPPVKLHPVAWFGRVVGWLDRDWRAPLLTGVLGAVLLPLAVASIGWLLVTWAVAVQPWVGGAVAGIVLWTTSSLRMLLAEATGVVVASETDPVAARQRLPALVGRDPSELSPAEIRSAAVESAAENCADGLVAPLCAFALCLPVSLPLAVAAAVWIKAVNTMDSMLGYPDKRVGTAAARLDDLAMWIPARVTAGLIALSTLSPRPAVRGRAGGQATASPNAGWPMGALAGAVDVRLVKPDTYELNPTAELPEPEQARRAIATVGRAGLLAYALTIGWALLLAAESSARIAEVL